MNSAHARRFVFAFAAFLAAAGAFKPAHRRPASPAASFAAASAPQDRLAPAAFAVRRAPSRRSGKIGPPVASVVVRADRLVARLGEGPLSPSIRRRPCRVSSRGPPAVS
jgi:hypothetical protein